MPSYERIVSIYPTSHGFGFAVFEDGTTLIDWGHAHVRPATHSRCLERIVELLSWYTPSMVVMEDVQDRKSRRGDRVQKLLNAVAAFVARSNTLVAKYNEEDVRKAFLPTGNVTKHDMAKIIAAQLPELRFQVPPPRKIWMSEDERMSIFHAAALCLASIHGER
jgi:Holliday junction resolvasome RuvABC endonuclease subunit